MTCPANRCDGRSLAGRIRKQARQKVPDIMLDMLKDAMKAGHKARYVLFDSLFATPKGITDIKKRFPLDVLAMLKKLLRQYRIIRRERILRKNGF